VRFGGTLENLLVDQALGEIPVNLLVDLLIALGVGVADDDEEERRHHDGEADQHDEQPRV
jgi:hypothetical protein